LLSPWIPISMRRLWSETFKSTTPGDPKSEVCLEECSSFVARASQCGSYVKLLLYGGHGWSTYLWILPPPEELASYQHSGSGRCYPADARADLGRSLAEGWRLEQPVWVLSSPPCLSPASPNPVIKESLIGRSSRKVTFPIHTLHKGGVLGCGTHGCEPTVSAIAPKLVIFWGKWPPWVCPFLWPFPFTPPGGPLWCHLTGLQLTQNVHINFSPILPNAHKISNNACLHTHKERMTSIGSYTWMFSHQRMTLVEKNEMCGLVGKSMSLTVSFGISNTQVKSSVTFFFCCLWISPTPCLPAIHHVPHHDNGPTL